MIRIILSDRMEENCYLVEDENGIVVIDPGIGAADRIIDLVGDTKLSILITHGHADHIFDIDRLKGDNIFVHPLDRERLLDAEKSLLNFFGRGPLRIDESAIVDCLQIGEKWRVIHTPGHTPGSCCYLYDGGILFTGDTVFMESIGRTDLPGGSEDAMIDSLRLLKEIFENGPDLKVFPGHGPGTDAREILIDNPFFR